MHITFTENLNEPFGACEPSVTPADGNHTAPAEYVIPEDSKIYTHEVMPDTWVFTDGLGRVSLTNAEVGDPRTDRTLALFYWTWHGFLRTGNPFNNQKFLEENPDALRDYDHPGWPVSGYDHFWNQPVYGYYKTTDTWVLRRQAEMLANAGVDTIFTDNTNGILTWRDSYRPLMQTWSDAMDDGVRTPKVSFMLPFGANEDTRAQLKDLYLDIYRKDVNQKLWFYWEGKPMLMAHGGGNLLNSADNTEKEIKNFFTFRANYPGYINNNPGLGAWGWLSTYPQAVYYGTSRNQKEQKPEQITVGVAMNHDYKLGLLAAMNGYHIMGRSYTSSYQDRYEKEGASATLWGYNFSEQFDYALKVDPKVVFVTGWNEWVAGRYKTWIEGSAAAVENAFPDQCNDEFSRDLEPTRGDLRDNYYYLLVNYVRSYKGARPIPTLRRRLPLTWARVPNSGHLSPRTMPPISGTRATAMRTATAACTTPSTPGAMTSSAHAWHGMTTTCISWRSAMRRSPPTPTRCGWCCTLTPTSPTRAGRALITSSTNRPHRRTPPSWRSSPATATLPKRSPM